MRFYKKIEIIVRFTFLSSLCSWIKNIPIIHIYLHIYKFKLNDASFFIQFFTHLTEFLVKTGSQIFPSCFHFDFAVVKFFSNLV